MSQKPHVQISVNFLYTLPVAVTRSSSDGNTIRYLLPVLWMTSCFHIMERMDQNHKTTRMFRRVFQMAPCGRVEVDVYDCRLVFLYIIIS